jgi:hypothetical protein
MTRMPTERLDGVSLQFYDEVAPLVHELGRAMCVALDQGHAVLCVVSDSTRRILEEQLTQRGIDVGECRAHGQYVHLNAVDVLSKITRDGGPDPIRFHEVVGRPVERLVREYPGVWMYGELASIMWSQGYEQGAIQLDQLWASFAESQPVVLCVAFPVEALSWPIVIDALQETIANQIRALANGSSIALAIHHGPTAT